MESGADSLHREGRDNVRADMLSCLHYPNLSVVNTENYIESQKGTTAWSLPSDSDGINRDKLQIEQAKSFPNGWEEL